MIYEVEKGLNFYEDVKNAKNKIDKASLVSNIDMIFNEISITIHSDSNNNDIYLIYDLKHKIRRLEAGYKD
jgi:hypothetical protein